MSHTMQMKGPEATSHIRDLGFRDIKIYGLTGNVMKEDRTLFLKAGADLVLEKPLDIDAFDNLMM